MTRTALLSLGFAPCLALAACEEPAAGPTEQGGAASGEVLEGSISDAMIPLEQLESEAPLAPRQAPPVGDIDAERPEAALPYFKDAIAGP